MFIPITLCALAAVQAKRCRPGHSMQIPAYPEPALDTPSVNEDAFADGVIPGAHLHFV